MARISVFVLKNWKLVEEIENVESLGIHNNYTAIGYRGEDGEFTVKFVDHAPDTYICPIIPND